MAAQGSSTSDSTSTPSVEEAAERIRALNEKVIEAAKAAGGSSLDAYEKALSNMLEFENKVADASPIDWVSALVKSHSEFMSDVASSYTKAARELLK